MERYLLKINNLIHNHGIDDNKVKIRSKGVNLNLGEINNLLKEYHRDTKIYYKSEKKISNPRPLPIFKFDNKNNIGYIKFFKFMWTDDIYMLRDLENINELVTAKLKLWEKKDYNKLIIDLRDHDGGDYISVIESLYYILGNLTLFSYVNKKDDNNKWINLKNGKILDFPDVFRNSKLKFNGKIAVLISNKTKDGGEIVATILKDRDNIKLIGEETYGNIYLSKTFVLDIENGLYIKLPSNKIESFNNKIYSSSIKPDINEKNNILKSAYKWLLSESKLYTGKENLNKNQRIYYNESSINNLKIDYNNIKINFDSSKSCVLNKIIFINKENMQSSLPIITKFNSIKNLGTIIKYKSNFRQKTYSQLQYRNFENSYKKLEMESIYPYIKEKFSYDIYNFNYSESILTTFNYLFNEMGSGIFCNIKNNKINKFIPFSNFQTNNSWYKNIKQPKEFKTMKEYLDYKNKIFKLRNLKTEYDMSKWAGSDCLIYTSVSKKTPFINSNYWTHLLYLLQETVKNKKVPDCTFFLNKKDPPIIKKNRTQAFESLWGPNKCLDIGKYYYFCPILSQSTKDNYGDIPIPTADDINIIFQKVFSVKCVDDYVDPLKNNIKWEDKINTAFFRGSGTGCSTDIYKNQRLHLTKINHEWKKDDRYNENNSIDNVPFLDAGISIYNERHKINDLIINFNSKDELKKSGIHLLNFVSKKDQLKYKYNIYVEGHTAAYRLGYMLLTNSLVLYVKSKFKSWLNQFIKPDEHYILINSDYSDLAEKIEWCKKNDSKVKTIVDNANKLMKKILSKNFVYEYMGDILNNIASKQFFSEDIYLKYKKYQKTRKILNRKMLNLNFEDIKTPVKTLIIIPFRDNKYQDRKSQLDKFINFWSTKKLRFDIEIYIVEQSKDNRKFNRGQLLNIGIKYGLDNNFKNIILHDVDLLPNDNLLPYYFYNSDIPIHLASNWKKYDYNHFFGGVTLLNDKLLKKINGFPNNIWGWGGEDDILYNRIAKYINYIYDVKSNAVLDEMEHVDSRSIKSIRSEGIILKKLILENYNSDVNIGYKDLKKINILEKMTIKKNIIKVICELE